jgi:Putative rhamnosyl transferase
VELLVATRFGAGIKDPAGFDNRLVLLDVITAPSLLSQTDQGFRWVVFSDRQARHGLSIAKPTR